MIVGSGTGAILAACIGINKIPIRELGSVLEEYTKCVVKKKTKEWEHFLATKFPMRFSEANNTKDAPKVALVCSDSANKPVLFRTYVIEKKPNPYDDDDVSLEALCKNPFSEMEVWKGIRASCAEKFGAFAFKGVNLTDGGHAAPNPTELAIQEASLIWADLPVSLITSIGLEKSDGENYPWVLQSERIHENVERWLGVVHRYSIACAAALVNGIRYVRLTPSKASKDLFNSASDVLFITNESSYQKKVQKVIQNSQNPNIPSALSKISKVNKEFSPREAQEPFDRAPTLTGTLDLGKTESFSDIKKESFSTEFDNS